MSATGRGGIRSPNDFYRTPANVTRAIVERLYGLYEPFALKILDAGCGDGAITEVLSDVFPKAEITGIDIDAKLLAVAKKRVPKAKFIKKDFLKFNHVGTFDVVIGNPPYKLAQEFIEHALRFNTETLMLLRLGFLESVKRASFHETHSSNIHVLVPRPSFIERGSTDASAYAWFHYPTGNPDPSWEILRVEK